MALTIKNDGRSIVELHILIIISWSNNYFVHFVHNVELTDMLNMITMYKNKHVKHVLEKEYLKILTLNTKYLAFRKNSSTVVFSFKKVIFSM